MLLILRQRHTSISPTTPASVAGPRSACSSNYFTGRPWAPEKLVLAEGETHSGSATNLHLLEDTFSALYFNASPDFLTICGVSILQIQFGEYWPPDGKAVLTNGQSKKPPLRVWWRQWFHASIYILLFSWRQRLAEYLRKVGTWNHIKTGSESGPCEDNHG